MEIFQILIIFIVLFIITTFSFTWFTMAPWVPTRKKDLKRINKLINLQKWESFFEIWCWDWTVCNFIWKQNPNSKITWIELSIPLFLFTKVKNYFFWPKNVEIVFWNFLNYKINNFDYIYLYMLPKSLNSKIKEKAENEIKKWWKIISYEFKIKNWKWKILEEDNNSDWKKITIYEK